MNALRLWVVLFVALLLPLRDAVAATMRCAVPPAAAGTVQADAPPQAVRHALPSCHEEAGAAVEEEQAPDEGASPGACPVCASGCHAAALTLAAPRVPGALPRTAAAFPPLHVPAPAFEADGPERPPRTA